MGWWRAASSANGRSGCGISLPPRPIWGRERQQPRVISQQELDLLLVLGNAGYRWLGAPDFALSGAAII